MSELRENRIEANGLEFATWEAGPEDGPLALCLHGFPDCARSFRHLLPRLAKAGYRAVAPNMRGYAPTAIPADGAYQAAVLARDALGLIEAHGYESAALIGHDWGAMAAHGAAILAPERVNKLVSLALPPPGAASLAIVSNFDQGKRSWYIFFFLTPFAEPAVAANDFAFIDRLWADWSPGFELEASEREAIKQVLRQPGVLQAAIGYYRGNFDPGRQLPELAADQARVVSAPIEVGSLHMHGDQDGCIGAEVTQGMEAGYTKGVRQRVVKGSGHFLHLEQPDVVNAEILEFLGPASR